MPANDKRFSFVSMGMPGDTFGVVRFKGQEALSTLYQFEIELVAWDPELDMNEVIQNPAYLTILRNHGDMSFNGMLSEFEQKHQVGAACFYRAVLVPRVWWLSQNQSNQVLLDANIEDICDDILRSADFTDDDFEIKLEKDHPKMDYICQYRESHLSFMQRLMEREGIYYYFAQTAGREKMIITDTRIAHDFHPLSWFAYYRPPGMQDYNFSFESVRNFSCRQKMIPQTVRLKTYNWEHPGMDLECSEEVFEEGRGEVYIYGDNFKTEQEGKRLAAIRAEEILCWKESYFGDSDAPFLQPGYIFSLFEHFRSSFNQRYMTVEVSHEGNQSAYMLAGISRELAGREQEPTYFNSFTAIPGGVQFRPCRKTEKPRFYGSLNAKIDAAGDGTYAELNENGCYKVKLPFDRADRQGGKASAWIRMMQPYAGSNYGIHFPLHKGAE
ncbi:MAG: type VI secretion system Vgr family protein, partial [Desulfosalsimonas sp.]